MSAAPLSTSVNKHYLSKVMGLADVMDVAASEDIVDMRGMKLVAKGTRLTRTQQNTLGMHKLRTTLESSLIAEGATDTRMIADSATRLIDTSTPLRRILATAAGAGPSPLALIGSMRFGHAMRMMLTLTDRNGPAALDHSIIVSLLSMCMAKKLRLSPDEQLVAGLAGLLHDIGELYIDPAYLEPGKRLQPHEWAHLVVHPKIGQMLIGELESYPSAVGRAVAEHHERCDGTGYPRQIGARELSAAGQALSVAEMIAGVLGKDHPLERAELALKIIPGEHRRDLLAAISGALHTQENAGSEAVEDSPSDCVERLYRRIEAALDAVKTLSDGSVKKSPRALELLERSANRLIAIQRAFVSTGLDYYMKLGPLLAGAPGSDDNAILFEKAVATREMQWRLRDIARDLALNTAAAPDDAALLAPLVSMLDDDAAHAPTPSADTAQAATSFGIRQQVAA